MSSKQFSIQAFGLWACLFLLYAFVVVLFQGPLWSLLGIFLLPFLLLAISHPRVLFYCLLIAIPPSIEYSVTETLATDLPDEPLIVLCSFIALAAFVWQWGKNNAIILTSILTLLLLQLCWQTITVFNSTDQAVSLKFLLAKLWYLGAFVLFPLMYLKEKKYVRTAAMLFTVSAVACVFWVFVQHARAGFSFSAINNSVQPFFRNHVNYSVVVVSIVPVLCAFIISVKTQKQKFTLILLLIIVLAALYFSYSRGAWLALAAGVFGGWLLKKRLLLFGFATAVVIALSAFFYLAQNDRYEKYGIDYNTTIFHTNFGEHWAATYQMKDLSTAERFYRWIAGFRMAADKWQAGWGPNTFYPAYKEYTTPSFKTWVSSNPERSTVHNYFLLTFIEQGVPGLILLLLLLACAFYTVQKVFYRTADVFWRLSVGVSGIVLVQLCTVNFLSDLVETDEGGSLFYLSLAIIVLADIKTRASKFTPHM